MANFRACSICPPLQVMAMPVTWTKCAPAWAGPGKNVGHSVDRALDVGEPDSEPSFATSCTSVPSLAGTPEASARPFLFLQLAVLLRQRCTVCTLISLVLISVCLQVFQDQWSRVTNIDSSISIVQPDILTMGANGNIPSSVY